MTKVTYMGRMGVRKGPWSPEEDIKLASYIQEHGPGNWKDVPIYAGLRRCSKSCRLRWRNYLRPGIVRGNYTPEEEKLIMELQSLFGNKWAVIASYFPHRTDNDIKNYWNSHLKRKREAAIGSSSGTTGDSDSDSSSSRRVRRAAGVWERRLQTNVDMTRLALSQALAISPSAISTATTAAVSLPDARSGSMGFMGGTKSGSYGFSSSLIRDHRLTIGPEETQAPLTTSDHVFSADNIAKMLDNWTSKPPVRTVSEHKANSSTPVAPAGSHVGCLYFANTATFSDVMTVNHPNFNINIAADTPAPTPNHHLRANTDVDNANVPSSFGDFENFFLDDPSQPFHPVPAQPPAAYNYFGNVLVNEH